ncbi:hypothetical protein M0812_27525 [Anaeramoeba flamelloides]|uniref:Uncharacterized protein n=1 Tax=Anaeramoeba flamelloides TaxID=1746091 RepID=A0AAV7Y5Q2_9EUKA|nr:hypothetical protein M0812_27525 [Anaeramoeba flamelloides]
MDLDKQQFHDEKKKFLSIIITLKKKLNGQKLRNRLIKKEKELLERSLKQFTKRNSRRKFQIDKCINSKHTSNEKKTEMNEIENQNTESSKRNDMDLCSHGKNNKMSSNTKQSANQQSTEKTFSKLFTCQKKLSVMELNNSILEQKVMFQKQKIESLNKKLEEEKKKKKLQINLFDTFQKDIKNLFNNKVSKIDSLEKAIKKLTNKNKTLKTQRSQLKTAIEKNRLLNTSSGSDQKKKHEIQTDSMDSNKNRRNNEKEIINCTNFQKSNNKNDNGDSVKKTILNENCNSLKNEYRCKQLDKSKLNNIKEKNNNFEKQYKEKHFQCQVMLKTYEKEIYQLKSIQNILENQNNQFFKEFTILQLSQNQKNSIINSYQEKVLHLERKYLKHKMCNENYLKRIDYLEYLNKQIVEKNLNCHKNVNQYIIKNTLLQKENNHLLITIRELGSTQHLSHFIIYIKKLKTGINGSFIGLIKKIKSCHIYSPYLKLLKKEKIRNLNNCLNLFKKKTNNKSLYIEEKILNFKINYINFRFIIRFLFFMLIYIILILSLN